MPIWRWTDPVLSGGAHRVAVTCDRCGRYASWTGANEGMVNARAHRERWHFEGRVALCPDEDTDVSRLHAIPCGCVDVDFGTYAAAVPLYPPTPLGLTRIPISVDRCIASEVADLWDRGIVTTHNCCGHNKARADIGVDAALVGAMLALGYERNPCHSDPAANVFLAKTLNVRVEQEERRAA